MGTNTSSITVVKMEAELTGQAFEHYVASLYRALGYRTTANINLNGQQIDLLAEKIFLGAGMTRLAIECKFRNQSTVSNSEVQDFSVTVRHLVDRGAISLGIMVTNSQFSAAARAAIEGNLLVKLITTRDLEDELFGVSEAYQQYVQTYEGEEIFNVYVPHRGTLHLERLESGSGRQHPNIHEELKQWLLSSADGPTFLLGDFGAGKTTLVNRLKFELAKLYLSGKSNLKPVLILLREYFHHSSLESLLSFSLQREFGRPIPLSIFWSALAKGELLLLLDGLDEMSPQADEADRRELLIEISPILLSASKAVLTSRPSFFASVKEFHEAVKVANQRYTPIQTTWLERPRRSDWTIQFQRMLFKKVLGHSPKRIKFPAAVRVIVLGGFESAQIDEFLEKYQQCFRDQFNVTAQDVRRRLDEIYDLADLMTRPILLKMIVETVLAGVVDLFADNQEMGGSLLYEVYTWLKLEADWDKGEIRQQVLTREERRLFSQAVALTMYRSGALEVSYDQILALLTGGDVDIPTLSNRMQMLSPNAIANDINVCTFLTWGNDSQFRFVHRSFMEFFVARHLKVAIGKGVKDPLLYTKLPKEILYFFGGFGVVEEGFRQLLIKWLRYKQPPIESTALFRRNLSSAILYSGPLQQGLKLRDLQINEIDVRKVAFNDLELKAAVFDDVTWSRVRDKASKFESVKFQKCGISRWTSDESKLALSFDDVEIDSWKCSLSEITLATLRTRITGAEFEDCRLAVLLIDTVLQAGRTHGGKAEITFEGGEAQEHTWSDLSLQLVGGMTQYQSSRYVGGRLQGCKLNAAQGKLSGRLGFYDCSFERAALNLLDEGKITFEKCKFVETAINSVKGKEIETTISKCDFNLATIIGLTLKVDELEKSDFIDCVGLIYIAGGLSTFTDADAPFRRLGEHLILVSTGAHANAARRVQVLLSDMEHSTSNSLRSLTKGFIKQFGIKTWGRS